MGVESCIQTTLDGATLLDVEVQPGSSRQGIVGFNEWRNKLQIAVKAEAKASKANYAVCNILKKIFSKKTELISGKTSRSKKIKIYDISSDEILDVLGVLFEP